MQVPIVFIIFNRPQVAQQVFNVIRRYRPKQLFVIADGARETKAGEYEKCLETRKIIDQVDWDCEVHKNFSEVNLGCAKRISSGLNWVFEQVESAVILEDDCLAHADFFPFCETLLERYRDDERIMAICAQNVQFGRRRSPYSYYYSRYNHCWGWATWRRAWNHFDFDMKLWHQEDARELLKYVFPTSEKAADYWARKFQRVSDYQVDSWALRWTFACWMQSGLSIIPEVNLVSNIGYGTAATNTLASSNNPYANLPTNSLDFPLQHPPFVLRNAQADSFTQNTLFQPTLTLRIKDKLRRTFKK